MTTTIATSEIKTSNWLNIGGILVALLDHELLGIAGSVCLDQGVHVGQWMKIDGGSL